MEIVLLIMKCDDFQNHCEDVCDDFLDEFNYPQVDEDTEADVDLHCTGGHVMMIKFNPGMYIIEQSVSNSSSNVTKTIKGSIATFTNLTPGIKYRYRLYNFTKEGISRPETSEWFTTYEADYRPLPVKSITLLKLEAEKMDKCNLRAEVAFEPAEDRSCYYNVLSWGEEHDLWNFNVAQKPVFRFELNDLKFSRTHNVTISSLNGDTESSSATAFKFHTFSCLEYCNDLTTCAPESVKGLRAECTYNGEFYELKIYWNKSLQEPDSYTIEIDSPGDDQVYSFSVPGNRTEVYISNLNLGPKYKVRIIAESLGGISLPVAIENFISEQTTINREVIIGITTLSITIVVLAGMIFSRYYKQRNKKFFMECGRFEDHNQKDLPIEITKKLLSQNYDSETNDPIALTLTHEYELCPKLLKLKGVLGSGAYGVVRLGSLQHKSNNITEVAVKMLKDNPGKEDLQNFHKEILIMKFVGQHPNIVSLIGFCNMYNKPVLVIEYCCKGDLQTYLRTIWQNAVSIAFNRRARFKLDAVSFTANGIECISNNSGGKERNYQNINIIANRCYDIQQDIAQYTEIVTANDLLNFARQITTGMEFLSSKRIVHRDLAARNILVCADRIVKISDFGLSRDVYQENLYRKKGDGKLPLKWMAIEALTHQIYTTYSDVWSFGILLWEIVTMGALPYPEISSNAVLKLLKSGYRMEQPLNCSIELYNIMFSCWNVRPQSRPTFTQLKEGLDKLLSYHSGNKYLNIDEILYEAQEQYRISEK
ncbi:PREDICTED: tyrosine-protein kinase receptor torso-like [Habropoda laboriosa]|uniref:tyrosine-protein kinase receptor torso-like n=1 Tax=Habropoda laboriosa TaxID=597456 RepID=UPI00083CDD10|nr:PREDICTED: tyrosine-protein kinase receptor torso-like [Habropoda laboriosa]